MFSQSKQTQTKPSGETRQDAGATTPRSRQIYPLTPPPVLGAPDHPAEREADEVSGRVVRRLNSPETKAYGKPERISVTADPRGPSIRRRADGVVPDGGGAPVSPAAHARLSAKRGRGGFGLPGELQSSLGSMLGSRAREARLHHDGESDRLAREFGADAFSIGKDVFFKHGAYAPGSLSGKRLLAHELVHVAQDGGRGNVVRRAGGGMEEEKQGEGRMEEEQPPIPGGAVTKVKSRRNQRTHENKKKLIREIRKTNDKIQKQQSKAKVIQDPLSVDDDGDQDAANRNTPPGLMAASKKSFREDTLIKQREEKARKLYKEELKSRSSTEHNAYVKKILEKNADLSSSASEYETEPEVDHLEESFRALRQVRQPTDPSVLSGIRMTAQKAHDEIGDNNNPNIMSEETFVDVVQGQATNEMARVSNNPLLRSAHRISIERLKKNDPQLFKADGSINVEKLAMQGKKKTKGEEAYEKYRNYMGDALGPAFQGLKKKFTSNDKYKNHKDRIQKIFAEYENDISVNGKTTLSNSKDGRSFALHHNVNKGGKNPFPEGALSPYNLTVENDARASGGDVHAAHHMLTSAGFGNPYQNINPQNAVGTTALVENKIRPPKKKK